MIAQIDGDIGGITKGNPKLKLPLRFRFESKIDKTSSPTGCWLWLGYKDSNGYGKIGFNFKAILAHRLSYTFYVTVIPKGMLIRHMCHTPSCVNPEHLKVGTHKDNAQDMVRAYRNESGVTRYNAKLTEGEVKLIRKCKARGIHQRFLGRWFGVNQKTIWAIYNNKAYVRTL